MKTKAKTFLLLILCTLILTACSVGESKALPTEINVSTNADGITNGNPEDNEDNYSHSKDTVPDYSVVFPQDKVNRIDITLSPEAWSDLQTEMENQLGAFGTGTGARGQMPGEISGWGGGADPRFLQGTMTPGDRPQNFPDLQDLPDNFKPPEQSGEGFDPPQGEFPAEGNIGMAGMDSTVNSFISSTITFNGETWNNVGFRYSGNSTLRTSWSSGTLKISFRLDFDEFEDEDPSIKDQRFYGFKQLSLKSNAMDESYIREKVTADIFREAGVVSSQTAFYEVYIDYGEGPIYFGIYTAVEIVDDTLIQTQFSDSNGNVYKPNGSGASFKEGSFTEASFEKQTNQEDSDWTDIQEIFSALHSPLRTSDPAAWRAQLEAVFDVDAFVHWLAVDTILQNWDTYGTMAHNYYLYTDPEDGLVTWIPWDNNMAIGDQSMGRGNKLRSQGVRDLDVTAVSDEWPLISYLMDDPIYLALYKQYLQETIQTVWQPDELARTYQKQHDLIAPYVERETLGYTQLVDIESFESALSDLITHAQCRFDAVTAYLAGQ